MNIVRTINLAKIHIAQDGKSWLMELGIFSAAYIGVFGLVAKNFDNFGPLNPLSSPLFVLGLLGLGSYFASRVFKMLGATSGGFLHIQLPATTFEKLLAPTLITGPVFLLIYTLLFQGLTYMNGIIWNSLLEKEIEPFFIKLSSFPEILIVFFGLHAVFTLGSVFFKKLHFLKTGMTIVGMLTVIIIITLSMHNLFLSNTELDNQTGALSHLDNFQLHTSVFVYLGIALTYFTAWYKLKEREV